MQFDYNTEPSLKPHILQPASYKVSDSIMCNQYGYSMSESGLCLKISTEMGHLQMFKPTEGLSGLKDASKRYQLSVLIKNPNFIIVNTPYQMHARLRFDSKTIPVDSLK